MNILQNVHWFRFDNLSNFVAIFIGVFSVLILLYSVEFMKGRKGLFRYFLYIILTAAVSLGAVWSNNLIIFIVFWGFLGALLYLLIDFGETKNTTYTAKKAFIIIGGTDAVMLLGLAIIYRITGTFQMDKINIGLNSTATIWAYLCLAIGAFAKAGAMPFHTWVPDTAEDAPTPVTAFLPASLDKLLGIYFLARISLYMFEMNKGMNTFLMVIGSITIIAAVMMALIQHNFKRLLGYHAVSQVGYMILGIGTGNPIGIAGGLFHMLNHAIYKSCLFLSGGGVEKKAGTTDLEKLGGYAKVMPITFVAFLIASFAISGVPPFNGFASKWMIYQGIIETGKDGGYLWIIWLVAAMFGSALTLASFMKLIHSIFLGQPSKEHQASIAKQPKIGSAMVVPMILLAFLCVIFGVFAYQIPLKWYIFPSLGKEVAFTGTWYSGWATILIIIGIVIGYIIYLLGTLKSARVTDVFVGGEKVEEYPDMRVSGVEFYNTIKEVGILKGIYKLAEKKVFDIYEVFKQITFGFNAILRVLHTGVMTTYLAWCLLGMIILFYVLMR